MRYLEPKALSYVAIMGNVPRKEFRCYKNK